MESNGLLKTSEEFKPYFLQVNNMDIPVDKGKILLSIVLLLTALSLAYTLNSEEADPSQTSFQDLNGERMSFNLEGNISDNRPLDIETSYIRVDGMYSADTPEINIESETCLRFTDFSGQVDIDGKSIEGESGGFETCTMNATIDLTIDEKVDNMTKVSVDSFSSQKDFAFNMSELRFVNEENSEIFEREDVRVRIKDYQGNMILRPENGLEMAGEGIVEIDGEVISN